MSFMLRASIGVHAEVTVVMTPLKILVGLNHEVHFRSNVRLQNCGSNSRVIRHADGLANVVTQRSNHHFIVCSCALGHGGSL